MNSKLEENYKWVISCYDYKCKKQQEKLQELEKKIEMLQKENASLRKGVIYE